jgi:hypothetical protein
LPDIVTTLLDITGLACLVFAAFLLAMRAGFAVAGAAVLYVSWKMA